MRDNAFIDTNVLIYLYSEDELKQRIAYSYLNQYVCGISTQVATEFCGVCTRKLKFSPAQARDALQTILSRYCALYDCDVHTIDAALSVQETYGYSFYDSLVIASAIESGSRYLFTEDMCNGQIISGVRILNIFAQY